MGNYGVYGPELHCLPWNAECSPSTRARRERGERRLPLLARPLAAAAGEVPRSLGQYLLSRRVKALFLPSSHNARCRFERQARTAMPAPAATALDSRSQMSPSRTATLRVSGQRARSPGTAPAGGERRPLFGSPRLSARHEGEVRQRAGRVASPVAPAVSARSLPHGGGPPARDRQRRSAPTGLCLAAASRLVRPPSSIGRDGKFCGRTVAELARQWR